MPLSPRHITPAYAVQGQLQVADLAAALKMGFRSIINHRPDGEEPGQPEASTLARAAHNLGLSYAHIPVAGPITEAQRQAMRETLTSLPSPVLAFCRSGARSTRLWAHAMQDEHDSSYILRAAGQAGCDMAALAAELHQNRIPTHG